jgi:hypothetical protein
VSAVRAAQRSPSPSCKAFRASSRATTARRSLRGERIKCAEPRHSGAMCLRRYKPSHGRRVERGRTRLFATLRLASRSLHPWERDGAKSGPARPFSDSFQRSCGHFADAPAAPGLR